MSSGGGSTNTIEKADPWYPMQGYLREIGAEAQDIYQLGAPDYFPEQTYLDPNIYQMTGVNSMLDYASSPELAGMLGGAYNTSTSLLNPYSNPYANTAMGMADPSAYTSTALMGMGLGYNPSLYTPYAQVAGYADPNYALSQVMYGGGMNPYLDSMVNAAQLNSLQNYGMTTDAAANAYQYQIAPQIQDARTLISDALGQFTDQALPAITDQSIRSGNINSTRTDLAEGTALAGIYDTLNRDLTNLARTADLTGANVYQDMLRNQMATMDDVNAMAASMYGGAWDQSQSNLLSAANIAAGLQTNYTDAMLAQAQMDLDRQIAGEQFALDWGNLAGDMSNMGFDAFNSAYDTSYSNALAALGLMPQTLTMGTYPSQLYAQAGDTIYNWDAMALQDAIARWDYEQNADYNWLTDYASIIAPIAGMGGSISGTSIMDSNPYLGAMGGAMMGGTLGTMGGYTGATVLGMNPYTAIAGAVLGYVLSN